MHPYLIHQLLEHSATVYPDHEAVVLKNQSITYRTLENRSNKLARLLNRHGVKVGDRVGIMLGKSFESIIGIFGILKTGASYVPVDPAAPIDRKKQILGSCKIDVLISTRQKAREFRNGGEPSRGHPSIIIVTDGVGSETSSWVNGHPKIVDWQGLDREEDRPLKKVNTTDTDLAYILHTSGSTGVPKGVMISHLNAMTFINMAADFFSITDADRLCNHAPLYFDLSVFDIFVAVKCGATIVMVPENLSIFPIRLSEYIANTKISVWNSVSSVLALLADKGMLETFSFDLMRLVIFSGEILPAKHLRKVRKNIPKARFFNVYGQTEANSSTYYEVRQTPAEDTWKIPIGKSFPNFEVFIFDEERGTVTCPGNEGELFVRSSTVAPGYWNDKAGTEERFIPDPRGSDSAHTVYKTGDLARIDEDGNFVFMGRKDHMVKIRGHRVEMDEIEIVLNGHPSVKQAAVVDIPGGILGNKLIGCVSVLDGTNFDGNDILIHCDKYLPKYMIPEEIRLVDRFPLTPNGKIDRNYLRRKQEKMDGTNRNHHEIHPGRTCERQNPGDGGYQK